MKFLIAAAAACLAFVASSSAASISLGTNKVTTHQISMVVKVDGQTVMTPNVEVLPDTYGTVSLKSENGEVKYSLRFMISDVDLGADGQALSLDAAVYEGSEKSGRLLASPVLVFRQGDTPSAKIGSDTKGVSLEVTSHAVFTRDLTNAQLAAAKAGCGNPSPAPALGAAGEGCCSARCPQDHTQFLTCCNVIQCCGCGICCRPQ